MYYNSTDNGNVCSFHPPPGTRISKVTIERRKKISFRASRRFC